MSRYLIDENLPIDLDIFASPEFIHVSNIPACITDTDIWRYALDNGMTILTKDTDFYHRFISTLRSPKIVWFRIGNMKKTALDLFIKNIWKEIEQLLNENIFVVVHIDYIETM